MSVRSEQLLNAAGGITPKAVSDWGYALHLIESLPPTSYIHQAAKTAVDDLEESLKTVPPGPAKIYLARVRLAAAGLAKGINGRMLTRTETIATAKERKEVLVKVYVSDERLGPLASTGSRLMMLWGLGIAFILMRTVFNFVPVGENHHMDPNLTSLGLALATMCFWVWWKGRAAGIRLSGLFDTFVESLEGARGNYKTESRKQYLLAESAAMEAWLQYSGGEPPPRGSPFEGLASLGIGTGVDCDTIDPDAQPADESQAAVAVKDRSDSIITRLRNLLPRKSQAANDKGPPTKEKSSG